VLIKNIIQQLIRMIMIRYNPFNYIIQLILMILQIISNLRMVV